MDRRRFLCRIANLCGATAAAVALGEVASPKDAAALTCHWVPQYYFCDLYGEYMRYDCLWCQGSQGGGYWASCRSVFTGTYC